MSLDALASAWTDGVSTGYLLLFGLVLLGSVVPVVPTGAVVSAAAAFTTATDSRLLSLVVAVAALAALTGDLVTFAICRFGGTSAVRWLTRGQYTDRMDEVRRQFRLHGWRIVVAGRLLPAGRIPVLIAAGLLRYPWHLLVPASALAASLWAIAYALLGVVSGGIVDSPLLATVGAGVLVLVAGAVLKVVGGRGRRPVPVIPAPERKPEPEPEHCESA